MKECKICNIVSLVIGILNVILNIPLMILGLSLASIILLLGYSLKLSKIKKLGWKMLIAYDQAANASLGGDEDETISSRAGKRQNTQKWAKYLCWFLNKLDSNHCTKSIEEDEGKNNILTD